MKVEYDKETDTLMIRLNDGEIRESDEVAPGIIVDYRFDDAIIGVEILIASRHAKTAPEVPFTLDLSPAA